MPFIALGIAFLALGMADRPAFLGVGVAFLVIGGVGFARRN